MKQLSIIVPIYNVEPFVERCLISLENQDIPKDDYEIICINDGSPDKSREIVLQIQKKFNNIILIDQENQGVSRARNNGINRATGKYLLFIDPDDYVNINCFERILKNANEHKAQVSFICFTVLNENGTIQTKIHNEQPIDQIKTGTEAYRMSHFKGRTDPDRIYAVLFETTFININNLRFLPSVPYLEDGELIARILCLAKRCIMDGTNFYQRTTRPGSATQSKLFHSEKATNGFLLAANNLKRFQQEQNLDEKQNEFLNQPICKFVLLSLIGSMPKLYEFNKVKNKLKSLGLGRCALSGCNNFYRIEGFLYNFSPYLFLLHRKLGTPLLKILKP